MKTTRFLALALATFALTATAANARAQASAVSIRAPKDARPAIESGDVSTMAFTVRNESRDTIVAEPKIEVPAGWQVVMSPAATVVAPAELELWLISVKAPMTAAAGTYTIRVAAASTLAATHAASANAPVADSVTVTVAERHGLGLFALGSPAYVMAGEKYEGSFIIRNEGNVPARFAIVAKSSHGEQPVLTVKTISLAAGAQDTVTASVMVPKSIANALQELLDITVADLAVDTVRAEASMQTTIVPTANYGPSVWTIPGEVALRTSTPNSGVSRFTAWGSGKLTPTSDVMVDFAVRGPTGRTSVFGDQEEYRLALKNSRGSLRMGDQAFGFSRLIESGARSTGVEVTGDFDKYVAGAYVERNRLRPDAATEASAMVGTDRDRNVSGTLVGVTRSGSNIIASAGRATIGGSFVEVELAASDSQGNTGNAGALRLSGDSRFFSYDGGANSTTDAFASARQGSTSAYLSMSGRQMGALYLTGSTNLQMSSPTVRAGALGQRLGTATLAANFVNGTSVEYERFARADRGGSEGVRGNQNTGRIRTRFDRGNFDLSLNLQGSVVADNSKPRSAVSAGATSTFRFGGDQFVSLFADVADGRGLGEAGMTTTTTGINTEVTAADTRLRLVSSISTVGGSTRGWMSQTDVSVERSIRRSTLALRSRISSGANAPSMRAVFLEVKSPLKLPTAAIKSVGRAKAHVVDAETGLGVAGALVRLGGQAAVTDAKGNATFRNLTTGDHRAIVDGSAVAGRVVTNNASVSVSASSHTPAEFSVMLSRGSRIAVRLRRFEKSSAVVANGGDTLTEVGVMNQVVVALVNGADTVWQTSDDRGRVDFGGLTPGHYTISVPRFEAPDFMALAQKEFAVDVGAGEGRQVDFKLIPQIRAVEFVGETVLIAAPAKQKQAPVQAGPTTVTGKPDPSTITMRPKNQQNPTAPRQQQPQRQER